MKSSLVPFQFRGQHCPVLARVKYIMNSTSSVALIPQRFEKNCKPEQHGLCLIPQFDGEHNNFSLLSRMFFQGMQSAI
jgi:hypothetical protein